jgi:hypothetical protein
VVAVPTLVAARSVVRRRVPIAAGVALACSALFATSFHGAPQLWGGGPWTWTLVGGGWLALMVLAVALDPGLAARRARGAMPVAYAVRRHAGHLVDPLIDVEAQAGRPRIAFAAALAATAGAVLLAMSAAQDTMFQRDSCLLALMGAGSGTLSIVQLIRH